MVLRYEGYRVLLFVRPRMVSIFSIQNSFNCTVRRANSMDWKSRLVNIIARNRMVTNRMLTERLNFLTHTVPVHMLQIHMYTGEVTAALVH